MTDPMAVALRGVSFNVVVDPQVGPEWVGSEFWGHFAGGSWEPTTFRVFDRFISRDTCILDIGAWIGPTALYAARLGRQVYAFEPDPVAYHLLEANAAANPDIQNLELVNACVAERPGVVRMNARGGAGDSGSSILARGEGGWDVPAIRLRDFITEKGIDGPLFIKMDIEGYEYRLIPSLIKDLRGLEYTLYLSTHPHVLWDSIPASGHVRRLNRRRSMIAAQFGLVRALRGLNLTDSEFRPISKIGLVAPIMRGQDLTSDRTLIASTAAID